VSEQLYMLDEARAAALHTAHPVQELGNRLYGPVRRVDGPSADREGPSAPLPSKNVKALTDRIAASLRYPRAYDP
jgi:hypothetical protein